MKKPPLRNAELRLSKKDVERAIEYWIVQNNIYDSFQIDPAAHQINANHTQNGAYVTIIEKE